MADKPQPVRVLYCGVCSLPPEYCEFGSDFDKCKPWLIQNVPDLYPNLIKEANDKEADRVADKLQGTGISSGAGDGAASSAPKEEEKQEVIIEKVVRNKRKCITTVKGLELFGVKLSDASKKLGKKFATGASVVKFEVMAIMAGIVDQITEICSCSGFYWTFSSIFWPAGTVGQPQPLQPLLSIVSNDT
uniref:Translation machinery-associated protein 22 n=1 Tax=Cajanus cajan TaxID=3821 RepID=A0A151SWX7_CAJCA|nr:Translation machinery-associated protein 22 [Cajanus cajan]